jgi:predicted Zn-dependent protease
MLAFATLAAACASSRASAPAPTAPAAVAVLPPEAEPEPEPEDSAAAQALDSASPPPLTRERLLRQYLRQRARELLVAELAALEKLIGVTPESAVDRPLLMRRTASAYFELYLIELEADPGRAREALSRARALFDSVPKNAPAPRADLGYLHGLTLEQLGDLAGARSVFTAVAGADGASAEVLARAHYGIGLIAELAGARDDAARAYEQAREWLTRLGFESDEDRALRARIDERSRALRP